MTMDVDLYTSRQVAEMTGRKRVTILSLRKRYSLGRKYGRQWLFTLEDVARIQAINPLGGRPRKSGAIQYTKDPSAMRRKGPKTKTGA